MSKASGGAAASEESSGPTKGVPQRRARRRWVVTLHFGNSFNLEGFFHEDGSFFDTGRFRYQAALWHFIYGTSGEVMVQIKIRPAEVEFAPMRLERSADWGWRLISTGAFAGLVRLSSRQLSPAEHEAADTTPTEIVTLYLRRLHRDPTPRPGPYGVWQCFRAYQGTMPGSCWIGRQVAIEPGVLTVTFSYSDHMSLHCEVDELSRTIDVSRRTDGGEQVDVQQGVYQLEAGGQVLVVTRNELEDGRRPTGPPKALPTLSEILETEGIGATSAAANRNVVHI